MSGDEDYKPGNLSDEYDCIQFKLRSSIPLHLAKVVEIGEDILWTVPNFPVLTLKFTKVKVNIGNQMQAGLFRADDLRVKSSKLPFEIEYTSFCSITISETDFVVFWEWDIWTLAGLNTDSSEELSFSATDSYESSTSSGSETVAEAEETDEIEHTLPFKVLGVAHNIDRQYHLKMAHNEMATRPINVKIEPDANNQHDENAIAVFIDYHSGWKLVGFIPKELTKYIHPLILNGNIKKLSVSAIRYRVTYSIVGYYMTLNIRRKGTWERTVLKASRFVD